MKITVNLSYSLEPTIPELSMLQPNNRNGHVLLLKWYTRTKFQRFLPVFAEIFLPVFAEIFTIFIKVFYDVRDA